MSRHFFRNKTKIVYVYFCKLCVLNLKQGLKGRKTVGRLRQVLMFQKLLFWSSCILSHFCHPQEKGHWSAHSSSPPPQPGQSAWRRRHRDGTHCPQSEAVLTLSVRGCHWLWGAKLDTIQESWSCTSKFIPSRKPHVCTRSYALECLFQYGFFFINFFPMENFKHILI